MSTIGRSSTSSSPSVLSRPRPGVPAESLPRCPVRPPVVKPPHVDGFNPRPFGPDVRPTTKPAVDPFHPLQPKPVSVTSGTRAVDPFERSKLF